MDLKLLDRIQKLLALSGSPNEHEAAAAAAAVAKLLAAHALTLDAVAAATITEAATAEPTTRWGRVLLATVAAACGCRVVTIRSAIQGTQAVEGGPPAPRLTVVRVIGTAEAVRATLATTTSVSRVIARRMGEAWRAHVQEMTDPHYGVYPSLLEDGAEAAWQESFALGCVEAVLTRISMEMTRACLASPLHVSLEATPEALLTPTAVTRVPMNQPREEALARVDAYLKTRYPTLVATASEEEIVLHPGAIGQGRAESM